MNENTGRPVTSPAGLGCHVEPTHMGSVSGNTGTGHYTTTPMEARGALDTRLLLSADDRREPLPLGTIKLQPDGRCGCRACLLDAKLDELQRDRALAAVMYDLGVERLRAEALARVPAFIAAFEAAS